MLRAAAERLQELRVKREASAEVMQALAALKDLRKLSIFRKWNVRNAGEKIAATLALPSLGGLRVLELRGLSSSSCSPADRARVSLAIAPPLALMQHLEHVEVDDRRCFMLHLGIVRT